MSWGGGGGGAAFRSHSSRQMRMSGQIKGINPEAGEGSLEGDATPAMGQNVRAMGWTNSTSEGVGGGTVRSRGGGGVEGGAGPRGSRGRST